MKRKMVLSILLMLVLFFSVGAIQASEINAIDLNTNSSDEDVIQVDSNDLSADDDYIPLKEDAKNHTELICPNTTYGCYEAVLNDSDARTSLANKTVRFSVNETNYTGVTDDNGVVRVNFTLMPGKYNMTACFDGDETYAACNIDSVVDILPTIKANSASKYYKGSTKYVATLFDNYGNVLADTDVNITISGKVYAKKTGKDGSTSLPMNLKPGTYKVYITNPVTGYQLTTTFKILSTISSKNLKKLASANKNFSAKFLKNNGKALANKYVKFKISGKTYNVKTDSNGKATLSLKNFKKGTYKIVSYNVDGVSSTNTIKIYGIATTKITTDSYFYTFIPGETREIKIKFSTCLDDKSNAGKIIKVIINGKTYKKKTDNNGEISLRLGKFDKGFYTIEYIFDGNKYFKGSKTKDYVTIITSVNPKFTIKGTSKFGYGAGTNLKVALTSGGVPLFKRTVTLTLDGKTYTRTTDKKGMVSIPIDLKIGSYKVDLKSNTKYKVNGTSKSFDISVFKRAPAKIIWKSGNYFWDYSQTFKVLLTNSKGKALAGQTIELTIDSVTYTAKTSSKGYAKFKTEVALGKYKISLESSGDNDYLPASASKSVTVKLSKFGSGLNEKNYISYLGAYVRSSSHCPVSHAKIKALVNSLTSGLSDKVDKAKAIFNYVRDNVAYSYYYNSHKGALGALSSKSANCVDQASLLVAMYRTAGFKARYVHGTCVFSDGTFGHVWTQVLIDNTWVVGDPINYRNSLGKIKNWNTHSYSIKGKYVSVPF